MTLSRSLAATMAGVAVVGVSWLVGCESPSSGPHARSARAEAARAEALAATRLAANGDEAPAPPAEVPTRPVGPGDSEPTPPAEVLAIEVPDPAFLEEVLAAQLAQRLAEIEGNPRLSDEQKAQLRKERQDHYDARVPPILERLERIERPAKVELSFTDAVRRALENSYAIQARSYGPAVESTRIVEAEAQFDAVFFANMTLDKEDTPTASQLQGTELEVGSYEAGVRKLLSSGMQVQTSYRLERRYSDLVFQTLNPSYTNQFTVEFRQPLLKNFGLDFNRAQIEISKLDRGMSVEQLRRDIRELIYSVEQAYWRLVQARRAVGISAELITDLQSIYHSMKQRADAGYDMFRVQLSLPASRIEQREAEFIRLVNSVKNAEDTLKRLMNDPDLNMSRDIEIVPTDVFSLEPMVLDMVAEVAAGLMHRSELREAKLAIEQARLGIGVAKNQVLPRLDVLFRYVVDGLGGTADGAFDQLTANDFHTYLAMVEFEWPIGNRAGEAALRRARLQQAQALAACRDSAENTILEVQEAVREIRSSYDQIGPSMRAVEASREWLSVIKARQERRDSLTLEQELDAHAALASSQQQLLEALVSYNIALTNLERRKGTLLEYNNVVIRGEDDESYLDPYRPVGP